MDDRTTWGGSWNRFWVTGERSHFHHRFGVELRHDDIGDVALFSTRERQRLGTVRSDAVDQTSVGLFYELAWRFAEDWRAVLGLRGDYYRFDVDSNDARNSGKDSDQLVSPKLSLIHTLSDNSELYFSAGGGFHSNDARGTTITVDPVSGEPVEPVDPLVRSRGAELGLKSLWHERWNSALAAWYLELDSELLFVGDAGTTEASRPSRRWGLEFNNFWDIDDTWSLEADFAWTDAKFTDRAPEGNQIPGALKTVVTGALNAEYPSGWFGSMRLRWFGPYPLVEDGSVESDGSAIANLALGWKNDRWRFQADVLNLFDSNDHDIDYFYASRLPGEPFSCVEDIHYHVFEPRQLRVYASLLF